jgi:hypothetical protein
VVSFTPLLLYPQGYIYIYTYIEGYVCIVLFIRPLLLLKHFQHFRDSVNVMVWIVAQTNTEMPLLRKKKPTGRPQFLTITIENLQYYCLTGVRSSVVG